MKGASARDRQRKRGRENTIQRLRNMEVGEDKGKRKKLR
jgi:hypothetical protein